jgi:hypothetical protein
MRLSFIGDISPKREIRNWQNKKPSDFGVFQSPKVRGKK